MLEYVLGFGFGWTIFQALFMRDMAGGSYRRSLREHVHSRVLVHELLMGGMIPVMALAWRGVPEAHDPTHGLFWFRMSIALMVGFALAYPMNWWLVANHLKHGMMTVPAPKTAQTQAAKKKAGMADAAARSRARAIAVAAGISFAVLIFGLGIGIAGRG